MSRSHYYATHLLRETVSDDETITECGESYARFFAKDEEPSCPKCSRIYGERRLNQLAAEGKVLTSEPVSNTRYKSMYLVRLNGEPICYVAFPPGFGMDWRIHALTISKADEPLQPDAEEWPEKQSRKIIGRFHSLAAAMAAVPDLLKQGKVMTEATLRREAAAFADRHRRASDEDRRKRAEAAQALDQMLEGLSSILSRSDHGLSNFERNAVAEAHNTLTKRRAVESLLTSTTKD